MRDPHTGEHSDRPLPISLYTTLANAHDDQLKRAFFFLAYQGVIPESLEQFLDPNGPLAQAAAGGGGAGGA